MKSSPHMIKAMRGHQENITNLVTLIGYKRPMPLPQGQVMLGHQSIIGLVMLGHQSIIGLQVFLVIKVLVLVDSSKSVHPMMGKVVSKIS